MEDQPACMEDLCARLRRRAQAAIAPLHQGIAQTEHKLEQSLRVLAGVQEEVERQQAAQAQAVQHSYAAQLAALTAAFEQQVLSLQEQAQAQLTALKLQAEATLQQAADVLLQELQLERPAQLESASLVSLTGSGSNVAAELSFSPLQHCEDQSYEDQSCLSDVSKASSRPGSKASSSRCRQAATTPAPSQHAAGSEPTRSLEAADAADCAGPLQDQVVLSPQVANLAAPPCLQQVHDDSRQSQPHLAQPAPARHPSNSRRQRRQTTSSSSDGEAEQRGGSSSWQTSGPHHQQQQALPLPSRQLRAVASARHQQSPAAGISTHPAQLHRCVSSTTNTPGRGHAWPAGAGSLLKRVPSLRQQLEASWQEGLAKAAGKAAAARGQPSPRRGSLLAAGGGDDVSSGRAALRTAGLSQEEPLRPPVRWSSLRMRAAALAAVPDSRRRPGGAGVAAGKECSLQPISGGVAG